MQGDRRWDLWLGAAGLAVAVGDFALLAFLGVEMRVAGTEVTVWVFAWFAAGFIGVGYLLGQLLRAQTRERHDAEIIRHQVRALEASQRALIQQEKLAGIGRVAAGVAHEVRNPLGVIRSSASMVQESFDPGEEAHRACGFIIEEIDRLNGLIRSLLTFARPAELRSERIAVERAVDHALELARDALEARDIQVERSTSGSVPLVEADPDLVSQIVLDLVQNACEAVPDGGAIRIASAAENGDVLVEIRDDGPGIAETDREQIFEPFFTTKATGTGLGLPMASRIAQAHGGSLTWVPDDGGPRGRFLLRLPIDGAAAAPAPGASERAAP